MFGSHAPFFYYEAALLKLKESALSDEQRAGQFAAIMRVVCCFTSSGIHERSRRPHVGGELYFRTSSRLICSACQSDGTFARHSGSTNVTAISSRQEMMTIGMAIRNGQPGPLAKKTITARLTGIEANFPAQVW